MKKIGIVGHFTDSNSFGITKPYVEFWSQFGEVILITPYEKEARDLDLLVMPGGPDVIPTRYLKPEDDIEIEVGKPCMQKERFDHFLLPKYIAKRTPIFGTCRGMQSMYVYFGGKLNQHISHETNSYGNGSELVHSLKFENTHIFPELAPLFLKFLYNDKYKVNSRHHQTVDELTKPDEVTVLARHSKDKHIEMATLYPHYPAHLTQHHVEDIYDPISVALINHLLSL